MTLILPQIGNIVPASAASGITFVSSNTKQLGNNSPSMSFPAGSQVDDFYMLFYSCDIDDLANLPMISGATETQLRNDLGDPASSYISYGFVTGSPTTINFSSGDSGAVVVALFRGVNTSTPFDASSVKTQSSSGMPNPGSLTTVTANAMRVVFGSLDDDRMVPGAPSGYTMIDYESDPTLSRGSTGMVAYKQAPSTGAENPGAFTGSGNDDWNAYHFALRPA
jgi:hypothetical protein